MGFSNAPGYNAAKTRRLQLRNDSEWPQLDPDRNPFRAVTKFRACLKKPCWLNRPRSRPRPRNSGEIEDEHDDEEEGPS
jgi:hypothetical protein